MRIGHGFDVHRFGADRPLRLAGVTVPYKSGLIAHSDGDIVAHAVADALLGAASLGDIGRLFPDTDPNYQDISGEQILQQILAKLSAGGFKIANIDVTIIAQAPKLMQYIPAMSKNVAQWLTINPTQINLKATTTEQLGYIGREEGMAVHAVCLLDSI